MSGTSVIRNEPAESVTVILLIPASKTVTKGNRCCDDLSTTIPEIRPLFWASKVCNKEKVNRIKAIEQRKAFSFMACLIKIKTSFSLILGKYQPIIAFKKFQLSLVPGTKNTLVDFAVWVNTQDYSKGKSVDSGHAEIIGRDNIDAELGKLIIYLNRYARLIIKKGLADFPELISEYFTYLYILMTAESMTKIQLIEKNVHEKASGLEVIKRLLKHGLIAERDDENDKRSKRVFLTDKGQATFFSTLATMDKVSAIIAGKLTLEEKQQLFTLLKKLEDFHNPIFLNEKSLGLDELLSKLK